MPKSLEERIAENTEAVNRLAAALEAGGGSSAPAGKAAGKPAAGKAAAKPKGPTAEATKTAVMKVKEEKGADAAREIITAHAGDGANLAALLQLPETWAQVIVDCEAALSEEEDSTDEI